MVIVSEIINQEEEVSHKGQIHSIEEFNKIRKGNNTYSDRADEDGSLKQMNWIFSSEKYQDTLNGWVAGNIYIRLIEVEGTMMEMDKSGMQWCSSFS